MAQLALGVVGGVLGSFVGMPQLGYMIGSAAGAYLSQPDIPDTEGPRLADLSVTGSVEGSDIARAWGNVRLPARAIFSAPLDEVATATEVSAKGGPSGTNTTYTYYLTQLCSVGQVPPGTKLRRVWANKKLIFDASANADAVSAGYRFTWYDGSQTQPDPVYEAIVGAGNAPAYKGQGLLLVDAWNVTDEFGSRPPAIEVEICTNGTNAVVAQTVELGPSSNNLEDQWWSAYGNSILMSYVDITTSDIVEVDPYSGVVKNRIANNGAKMRPFSEVLPGGLAGEQKYLLVLKTNESASIYDLSNWSYVAGWATTNRYAFYVVAENNVVVLYYDNVGYHFVDKQALTLVEAVPPTPTGFSASQSAIGIDDYFLVYLTRDVDSAMAFAKLYPNGVNSWAWSTPTVPAELSGYNASAPGPVTDAAGLIWWPVDVTASSSPALLSTDAAGNVVDLLDIQNDLNGGSGSWGGASGTPLLHYNETVDALFFNYYGMIRKFDCARKTIETFSGGTAGSWCVYHPETDTCWNGHQNDPTLGTTVTYKVKLHTVEPVLHPVDTIVTDICAKAPQFNTATDLDLTALTPIPTVAGYVQTRQSTARAVLEPLLRAILAEGVVSDWQLKVVPLGGAVAATLTTAGMGARSATETAGPPVEVIEPESVALPNRYQLRYISTDRELQPAMASSAFGAAGSGKTVTLDAPLTLTDAEAAALCQQLHHLAIEQTRLRFSLPRGQAQLEPTDPVVVPTPAGDTVRARLTRVDRGANGVLMCEAVSDLVAHLTADAVAGGAGLSAATILSSSAPELIILDTPLLRDADADHPGPYLTAFTYGAGFAGAAFAASADGQTYNLFASSKTEPVLCTCATVPVSADFEAWDDTNTLRLTMRTAGTFASTTDADVIAGANAIAWGRPGRWELVQFGTATQIDATTWDLSHLLRGRRGTDWAMDLHAAGDWVVVLSGTSIVRHVLTVGDIAAQRHYRAPASNQALSDARATAWTVGDAPLRPYSPIGLGMTFTGKDGSLTWTRRTRGGGTYGGINGLTDGVGGPLREDNESYLITVRDDIGTALNTYTHSGPPPWAYPQSAIVADYGTYPSKIHADVAQISAAAGAGYAGQITQATPVSSAYVAAVETDGASHLWRLDDTATTAFDLISSLDGTYGGTYTQAQPSLLADATGASVAVNSGYVEVPAHADLQAMQTVEVLLVPAAIPTGNGALLVGCHDAVASTNGVAVVAIVGGGIHVSVKDGVDYVFNVNVASQLTVGVPVHIALEWDGFTTLDEIRLLVDGVVVASGFPTANWSIAANPLRAGQSIDSYWEPLDGRIQELAIYPTAVPVAAVFNHAAHAGTVDYATLVASLSPTLYLRLGESTGTVAADSSPNALNGTYVGSPTLAAAGAIAGDPDTAVVFDGVGSYVEVADNPLFNGLGQMTICAWVRLDDVAGDNVIIAKDAVTTGDRAFTLFFTDYATSPAAEAHLSFYAAEGAATARSLGTYVVGPDWLFVAAVFDGLNNPSVYVNGADVTDPATAASTVTTLPTTAAALRIANNSRAAQTTLLAGAGDEVQLYPAALTPAQIRQLYDNGRL